MPKLLKLNGKTEKELEALSDQMIEQHNHQTCPISECGDCSRIYEVLNHLMEVHNA